MLVIYQNDLRFEVTELKDCHCLYQLHLPGLEINLGIALTAFINVDNTLSQKFKPCICHMFELIYLTFYNDTFFTFLLTC